MPRTIVIIQWMLASLAVLPGMVEAREPHPTTRPHSPQGVTTLSVIVKEEAELLGGNPIDLSAKYERASGIPTATIDWENDQGPQPVNVRPTTDGNGVLTARLKGYNSPGVYRAWLSITDAKECVKTELKFDIWGAFIGDGGDNEVLIATPTGTTRLRPLRLWFPHVSGQALIMTLTSAEKSNLVWDTPTPTAGDVPLLGPDNTTCKFRVGPSESMRTFWIGATEGNTHAGVSAFSFSAVTDLVACGPPQDRHKKRSPPSTAHLSEDPTDKSKTESAKGAGAH